MRMTGRGVGAGGGHFDKYRKAMDQIAEMAEFWERAMVF